MINDDYLYSSIAVHFILKFLLRSQSTGDLFFRIRSSYQIYRLQEVNKCRLRRHYASLVLEERYHGSSYLVAFEAGGGRHFPDVNLKFIFTLDIIEGFATSNKNNATNCGNGVAEAGRNEDCADKSNVDSAGDNTRTMLEGI